MSRSFYSRLQTFFFFYCRIKGEKNTYIIVTSGCWLYVFLLLSRLCKSVGVGVRAGVWFFLWVWVCSCSISLDVSIFRFCSMRFFFPYIITRQLLHSELINHSYNHHHHHNHNDPPPLTTNTSTTTCILCFPLSLTSEMLPLL